MQVTHKNESNDYAILGGREAKAMTVNASAHFFHMLSDALYSDKPLAVVRETICNAVDAHIAAGVDRPIEITLTETSLTIKDFGLGIPDDKMDEIYGTLGGSTKELDDRQTGGFGLGCKSPFAVSDHFMVTSCHNGIRTVYALVKHGDDTEGRPGIKPMASGPCGEEQGLTVEIPITQQHVYAEKIARVVKWGGINAKVNGNTALRRDYSGLAEAGFGLFDATPTIGGNTKIQVLIGNVVYPLTDCADLRFDQDQLQGLLRNSSGYLVLYAPPSSVAMTPSREALSYTEKSIESLRKIIRHATAEIKKHYDEQYRGLVEFYLRKHTIRANAYGTNQMLFGVNAVVPAIGGRDCAHRLAMGNLASGVNDKVYKSVARRVFRDQRHLFRKCKQPGQHQFRYVTGKILRGLRDSDIEAQVILRNNGTGRNYDLRMPYTKTVYGGLHKDVHCLTDAHNVVLTPTRGQLADDEYSGYAIVYKKATLEQLEKLGKRLEQLGLEVDIIEPPEKVKRKPKSKVVAVKPADKFHPLSYSGSTYRDRLGTVYFLSEAGVESPSAYLSIGLTRIDGIVAARSSTNFNKLVPLVRGFMNNVVVPTTKTDLKLLEKKGVRRFEDILYERLEKSLGKNVDEAAAMALGLEGNPFRYFTSHDPGELAESMFTRNRRMMCLAMDMLYQLSKEFDDLYSMWNIAGLLYQTRERNADAVHENDRVYASEMNDKLEGLQKKFFAASTQPKKFKRLTEYRGASERDVEHLTKAARLVKTNLSNIRHEDDDDFADLVTQLIAAHKAEKKPKVVKSISHQEEIAA